MLAALSSQAAGAARRQLAEGTRASVAALQRRALTSSVDGETITVEVGDPQITLPIAARAPAPTCAAAMWECRPRLPPAGVLLHLPSLLGAWRGIVDAFHFPALCVLWLCMFGPAAYIHTYA